MMKMVSVNRCFALVTILEFLLLLGVTVGASAATEPEQHSKEQESSNVRPGERRLTTTTTVVWCVAKSNVSDVDLQSSLDWACGPLAGQGQVNCGPINVGGACFDPDTTFYHTSYAFNEYFLQSNGNVSSCDFSGTATITSTDISQGTCTFPGTNITVTTNVTDGSGAPSPSNSPVVASPGVAPALPPRQSAAGRGFERGCFVSMSTMVTLLTYLFT